MNIVIQIVKREYKDKVAAAYDACLFYEKYQMATVGKGKRNGCIVVADSDKNFNFFIWHTNTTINCIL